MMRKATVTIKGITPYGQGKAHETPKINGGKEPHNDYEIRTWREKAHINADGYMFIPPMAMKNCIAEAAKYLAIPDPDNARARLTKNFEAGIIVVDPIVLPIKKEDMESERLFVPSDGKRGGGTRVYRTFPVITGEWGGSIDFHIVDEKINKTAFKTAIEAAGQIIGIGRFRPRNNGFYGRFEVTKIKWS